MTKRLTRMALLTALALILFIIEAQIPPVVPISGVKLGLANIITVYAMFCLGARDTFFILICRILLGSVFSGQIMAFFYSFSGGILCYLAMLTMQKLVTRRQIWVCSIIGAIAHNIGQMIAAVLITQTIALVIYLPILLVSGIISGLFTGLCAQYISNRLQKSCKR